VGGCRVLFRVHGSHPACTGQLTKVGGRAVVAGIKSGIDGLQNEKSSVFSMKSVRPVLRRGCRKGWKRIGRRPVRLTCARAKSSDRPGPVRRPDRRQERRLSAYERRTFRSDPNAGSKGRPSRRCLRQRLRRGSSEPRGRRKALKKIDMSRSASHAPRLADRKARADGTARTMAHARGIGAVPACAAGAHYP
jgi:hypothetical protein